MPLHLGAFAKLCKARFSGIVVGGGTLIGPLWNREFFDGLVELAGPVFVHGTGVRSKIECCDGWERMLGGKVFGGVRGPLSVQNLSPIYSGLRIAGDAAFAMWGPRDRQNEDRRKGVKARPIVLINSGAHASYGGEDNTRGALQKFMETLYGLPVDVHFLPFHSIDIGIGLELKQIFPALTVLQVPATYREAKRYFQDATFAVGERLHFTVMAILNGCPFLSINYGEKHEDLLASLGLSQAGISPSEISADKITSAFEKRNSFDWSPVFQRIAELKAFQENQAADFVSSAK